MYYVRGGVDSVVSEIREVPQDSFYNSLASASGTYCALTRKARSYIYNEFSIRIILTVSGPGPRNPEGVPYL